MAVFLCSDGTTNKISVLLSAKYGMGARPGSSGLCSADGVPFQPGWLARSTGQPRERRNSWNAPCLAARIPWANEDNEIRLRSCHNIDFSWKPRALCIQAWINLTKKRSVCMTSWFPKFNGSHFGWILCLFSIFFVFIFSLFLTTCSDKPPSSVTWPCSSPAVYLTSAYHICLPSTYQLQLPNVFL